MQHLMQSGINEDVFPLHIWLINDTVDIKEDIIENQNIANITITLESVFLLWVRWETLQDMLSRLLELSQWMYLMVQSKLCFIVHFIISYKEINNFRLCLYYLIKFRYVVFLLQWDLDLRNRQLLLMKINLNMFLPLIELVLLILKLTIKVNGYKMFWNIMIFVDMDLLNKTLWIQILKIPYIIRLLLLILLKEVNTLIPLLYVLWLLLK